MKRFFKLLQNLAARPPAGKQGAGQTVRPGARKSNSVGKPHARIRTAAAPKDPILQARQDAAAAEAEVIKISRMHLATLMASPPRVRMAHFTDPELTAADKTELENSVRAALPRSAPVKATQTSRPADFRSLLQGCGYKCAATSVLLAAGGLLAGLAWHNTGERMVGSRATWIVEWRLPDGSIKHGAWKAYLPVIAMRPRNGKILLRYWLNGRGYATTEVDEDWLLRNSFDYVVGPTGGTGAVSPTNR